MTDKKLTLKDAVKLAEEVVAGNENYVYVDANGVVAGPFSADGGPLAVCTNWDVKKDRPSCVVGHILYRFGVSKEELLSGNEEGVDEFTDFLATEGDYLLDDDGSPVYKFLIELQRYQDRGKPWGEALLAAKQRVNWTS